MTSTRFDWSSLIAEMTDESFGIPTDVTFQIEDNGQLHEVKAHKMIMGMVSTTFKTMFYATNVGDKTANVIKVDKTTAPAFQIMMDAVYNVKSIEASLEGKSVHEVFDVMILVERYQIVELIEAVKKYLADYPVTKDVVLEVAADASEYKKMFEAEAQQLFHSCAKFLKSKLKDDEAVTRYAEENKDQGEIFADLLALMKDIPPCTNCQKVYCQDGETVKDDEFRVGLLVTNNKANGVSRRQGGTFGRQYGHGTGRVTAVDYFHVKVENVKPGVNHKYDGSYYYKCDINYNHDTYDTIPNFVFCCNCCNCDLLEYGNCYHK